VKLGHPVKTLLVDLDGTLLENKNLRLSLHFAGQALSTLRGHLGWKRAVKTLLAIQREFGKPSKTHTNDLRVIELFSKAMNFAPEEGRKFLGDALRRIFPSLEGHFSPVPGAKNFLEWAKDRYPMVLATNPVWPLEIVELRVKWAGVDPSIFKAINYASTMHACKPTTEYYEEILEQQSLAASDCLLIGDDVKMDLPATRAGIRVFIVGKTLKDRRDQVETPYELTHPRAKAKAWRGTFNDLRVMLDDIKAPT
jgi:FMN phosphatase YigB (HAD superfamily)